MTARPHNLRTRGQIADNADSGYFDLGAASHRLRTRVHPVSFDRYTKIVKYQ